MTKELGNERFCSRVQFGGATFESGATCGDTVTTKALFNGICTSSSGLSKAKVIVRRNIKAAGRSSS